MLPRHRDAQHASPSCRWRYQSYPKKCYNAWGHVNWTSLVASPEARGPRGGVRIAYENAGRYLTNTQFADLVGSGWVGSFPQDEKMLTDVIAQSLEASHSITLAIAQAA